MPRYNNRRYKKKTKRVLTKAQYNAVKKLDTKLEFQRSPMLRAEKSYSSWVGQNAGPPVTRNDFTGLVLCQAPLQDISLQVGTQLDVNQRLSSVIYPQVLKFSGTLLGMVGRTQPQRFRVMVIRYNGESDITSDNSQYNGWSVQNYLHACRPGELWSAKPFVKNQIKVLRDKEYVLNDSNKTGVVCSMSVPIKRKMTFETTSSGTSAVGAGNIYILISSDESFNLFNYRTYAFYKDLQ